MNIQRLLSRRQTGGKGAALRAKGGQAILPPHHFVECERVKQPAANQQTACCTGVSQSFDTSCPNRFGSKYWSSFQEVKLGFYIDSAFELLFLVILMIMIYSLKI